MSSRASSLAAQIAVLLALDAYAAFAFLSAWTSQPQERPLLLAVAVMLIAGNLLALFGLRKEEDTNLG
jgi:hypothetical protein